MGFGSFLMMGLIRKTGSMRRNEFVLVSVLAKKLVQLVHFDHYFWNSGLYPGIGGCHIQLYLQKKMALRM